MSAAPATLRILVAPTGSYIPDWPADGYRLVNGADLLAAICGAGPAGIVWGDSGFTLDPAGQYLTIGQQPLRFGAVEPMTIVSVSGTLTTAEGSAATLQPVKVPGNTAVSAGIPITTTALNANAAPGAVTLPLSGTPANLQLAAGDRLGVTTAGSWTASGGSIVVTLVPSRLLSR